MSASDRYKVASNRELEIFLDLLLVETNLYYKGYMLDSRFSRILTEEEKILVQCISNLTKLLLEAKIDPQNWPMIVDTLSKYGGQYQYNGSAKWMNSSLNKSISHAISSQTKNSSQKLKKIDIIRSKLSPFIAK